MALSTKQKNEPVEVQVLRAFRHKDESGKMVKAVPIKDKKGVLGKPVIISLPYQFAREMEVANKVSFKVKDEIEIEDKEDEPKK